MKKNRTTPTGDAASPPLSRQEDPTARISAETLPSVSHLRSLLLPLIIFCLYLVFARYLAFGFDNGAGIDFYQFRAITQGKAIAADIYADSSRARIGATLYRNASLSLDSPRERAAAENRKVLETYSTPFLYAVFSPFTAFSYETAYRLYCFLSLFCSFAGIAMLCHAMRFSPAAIGLTVTALLFWCEPMESDIAVGNVNQIQLFMVGLFVWVRTRMNFRHRGLLAGLILGAGIAFKPNLLVIALLLMAAWLIRKRFADMRDTAVGGGVAGVLSLLIGMHFFGTPGIWLDWITAMRSLPNEIITPDMGNRSLTHLIAAASGVHLSAFLAVALMGAVLVTVWQASRRTAGANAALSATAAAHGEDIIISALGCLVYLLTAKLVWMHYFILALPAAAVALNPESASSQKRWIITASAVCLTQLFIGEKGVLPFLPINLSILITLQWCALMTLFVLLCGRLSGKWAEEPAMQEAS